MYRVILAAIIGLTPTLVFANETTDIEEYSYLNVETVPDGVEIVVGPETIGRSPIRRLAFPPGEYKVIALFPGLAFVEKTVVLEAGTTTDIRFYSPEGGEKGWFSERDALIGFGLVCVVLGIATVINFLNVDWRD